MDDIQLIDVDPETRKVFFVMRSKKLKGISKLLQIVVLSLLNVPGRDVLDPEKGGGLPALLGRNIDLSDSTEVFGEVVRSIKRTEKDVSEAQLDTDDPPEEKLEELQIMDVLDGERADEIFVRIRLVNQAGQTSDIVV